MKLLEIIELRPACGNQEMLKSKLECLIKETAQDTKRRNIKIYNHATLDTGFCIHLLYESNQVEREGSAIGIHLASALKEFGLVSHSVWIELEKGK